MSQTGHPLTYPQLEDRFVTWAEGRPDIRAAIPNTFAAYDRHDLWRGLLATTNLFRLLAVETAGRLGYTYPTPSAEKISKWLESLRA